MLKESNRILNSDYTKLLEENSCMKSNISELNAQLKQVKKRMLEKTELIENFETSIKTKEFSIKQANDNITKLSDQIIMFKVEMDKYVKINLQDKIEAKNKNDIINSLRLQLKESNELNIQNGNQEVEYRNKTKKDILNLIQLKKELDSKYEQSEHSLDLKNKEIRQLREQLAQLSDKLDECQTAHKTNTKRNQISQSSNRIEQNLNTNTNTNTNSNSNRSIQNNVGKSPIKNILLEYRNSIKRPKSKDKNPFKKSLGIQEYMIESPESIRLKLKDIDIDKVSESDCLDIDNLDNLDNLDDLG
mmetsp:Transcript_95461/g.205965  ORF Transcript_95461/g.205965 Transcript_95461/m.205965 type:complete len:303 (-) Transcript_95461:693-1601(-)